MPGQNHHQPEDEYRYQHQSRVEEQLLRVHHQAMAERRPACTFVHAHLLLVLQFPGHIRGR